MIKDVYCYRVRMNLTLLTKDEYAPIKKALDDRMARMKAYQARTGANATQASRVIPTDALDLYERLTGDRLPSVGLLYCVCQDPYGRLCDQCGKPFRTPRATFCAECGYRLPAGDVAGPLSGPTK